MASYRKFYVVWEGRAPGIYDSWDEARAQVEGFPGARYRAYPDQISATEAFRSGGSDFPIEQVKKAGVDLTSKEPFEAVVSRMSELVDLLEKELEAK